MAYKSGGQVGHNLFQQAKDYVAEHSEIDWYRQKKPNTVVEVALITDHLIDLELGFSKCRWPDEFSEQYGIEMARKKAEADIARRLVASGWQPQT